MLLVTFHGGKGSGSINNVYAYGTIEPGGLTLLSKSALRHPEGALSELRGMVVENGYLYVANGSKATSNVLCFQHQSSEKSYHFAYVDTLIGATLHKGDFTTSIAHPFGLAFDGEGHCYVSNQDTNVVAQVVLGSNGQSGSLAEGCQSSYLTRLFPPPGGVFLDGTFVASQVGKLHDVAVSATDVPAASGGLSASFEPSDSDKVHNSVRDVAIANGILFVCDEPSSVIRMYALVDGSYLGACSPLGGKPTHLILQNGGLYAVAGSLLYWSPLPASVSSASLAFQAVAVTPPAGNTMGGISFGAGTPVQTVYVPFQGGTGGANGGSIYSYSVQQSSPSELPVFSDGTLLVSSGSSTFEDTPEFVLYVPDLPATAV